MKRDVSLERWDIGCQWTWMENENHEAKVRSDFPSGASTQQGYYPQWSVAPMPELLAGTSGLHAVALNYRQVKASWHLLLNALGVKIGKKFEAVKWIKVGTECALKAAWIWQKFSNHFFDQLINNNPVLNVPQYAQNRFSGKNQWWGIGPRAKATVDWLCGRNWSFISAASAALLYGQTTVSTQSDNGISNTSPLITTRQYQEQFNQLVPSAQLLLAIQWESLLRKCLLHIQAGWEANYWWNQFTLPVAHLLYIATLPTVGNQPLTLQGLTVQAALDF